MSEETVEECSLEKCRALIRKYTDQNQLTSALFWADKAVSLSDNNAEDVYVAARYMCSLKQYRRVLNMMERLQLHKTDVHCRYIMIQCLYKTNQYAEALSELSLDGQNPYYGCSEAANEAEQEEIDRALLYVPDDGNEGLRTAFLTLKGKTYEKMDNRALAAKCYKEALKCDSTCFKALNALITHNLLTSIEVKMLLDTMKREGHMDDPNISWMVQKMFSGYMGEDFPASVSVVDPNFNPPANLLSNADIEAAEAEKLYYNYNCNGALILTHGILKKDPHHYRCLLIHIGCLVEMRMTPLLFRLAHELVDDRPDWAVSWYCIGCYYYVVGKQDLARRNLGKATQLDPQFGPGWMAYGHSFAVENEHDQAMAAYFKAVSIMKGSHLPLLYVGLECGLANNASLSGKFFYEAGLLAPNDPHILHEMAVIAYRGKKYDSSEEYFLQAKWKMMQKLGAENNALPPDKWEPLYTNMGHLYRMMKCYEKALESFKMALLMIPLNAVTFTNMAFIHMCMGDPDKALDELHSALSVKSNDAAATALYKLVMDVLSEEGECGGEFADIPLLGTDLIGTGSPKGGNGAGGSGNGSGGASRKNQRSAASAEGSQPSNIENEVVGSSQEDENEDEDMSTQDE